MAGLPADDATVLAAALRAREISSCELLDTYLARIAKLDPQLNAVVTLDVERARARARALDEQLVRGVVVGPLHGLPITVKDAYETTGLRTTSGTSRYADHVPERNAVAVQRLVDAGAVVFGKTNVPAHCADVQTFNDLFGTTRNPHDLARTPGGSSGGAAVAVACAFTAFELGSDIGGSIRTPAHWTGVFGHKPSFGIVPQHGHIPLPPGALAEADLSVCGPLARSAQDLALLLDVLAGPSGAHARAFKLALPAPRRERLADYRIAAWLDDPAFPVDREVRALLEQAVAALRAAGAQVDSEARPDLTLSEVVDTYERLLYPVNAAHVPDATFRRLVERAETPLPAGHADDRATRFARASTARHAEWLRAHERRLRHAARLEQFFERFDVLLCPVNPVAAIAHDPEGSPLTRGIHVNAAPRPYMDLLAWISMATLAYLPATVAPVGRTAAGLPVGIQIVGAQFDDRTTIDLAHRLSQHVGGYAPPAGF